MKHQTSIVHRIRVTEKSTALSSDLNQYFFDVAPAANKMEIRRAIEDLFHVTVVNVNTMRYTGKKKRERRMQYGKRADWKRAVVTLKTGDQIDLT
jgi:large subunit ribosomal protein L23